LNEAGGVSTTFRIRGLDRNPEEFCGNRLQLSSVLARFLMLVLGHNARRCFHDAGVVLGTPSRQGGGGGDEASQTMSDCSKSPRRCAEQGASGLDGEGNVYAIKEKKLRDLRLQRRLIDGEVAAMSKLSHDNMVSCTKWYTGLLRPASWYWISVRCTTFGKCPTNRMRFC
jgi:hypothetical protein